MEDLDPNAPVPGVDAPSPEGELPSAGHDEGDPLAPEFEEENDPDPPVGEPYEDVEATGGNEIDKDDLSDNESLLSDVDEDQFQDFDPAAISLEDRQQIAIDDDNVKLLGVHKRKRAEGEGDDTSRKKKKERRRDKTAKKERRKRNRDGSEPFSGGEELDGKRRRKRAEDGEGGSQRRREEVDESLLPPEERKRRELDRKMDEALRSGKTRISKKDGIVSPTCQFSLDEDLCANSVVGPRTSRRRGSIAHGPSHGRSRPSRLRRSPALRAGPSQTSAPPRSHRHAEPWRRDPRIHRRPRERPATINHILLGALNTRWCTASVCHSEGVVRRAT